MCDRRARHQEELQGEGGVSETRGGGNESDIVLGLEQGMGERLPESPELQCFLRGLLCLSQHCPVTL
jgi:hypothetical protein